LSAQLQLQWSVEQTINVYPPCHQSGRRRVLAALVTTANGAGHPTSAALITGRQRRQGRRSIYRDRTRRAFGLCLTCHFSPNCWRELCRLDFKPFCRLMPKTQSAYQKYHSTETAVTRVYNDLLLATDRGQVSALCLLDLTAAFDTVDHELLLLRLEHQFGLRGTALMWFHSYLSGRASIFVNFTAVNVALT